MDYEHDLRTGSIIKRSFVAAANGSSTESVQVLTTDGLTLAESPTKDGLSSWADYNAARANRPTGRG